MTKHMHYITLVANNDSTIIDIDLTQEEYELLNRISTLTFDTASSNCPVLVISKPIPSLETEKEELSQNTSSIPIIKQL